MPEQSKGRLSSFTLPSTELSCLLKSHISREQHLVRQVSDRAAFIGRYLKSMFRDASYADAQFERLLGRTNKFSLWIQLVVGFGVAVLFLHYCCVEAAQQKHHGFLFFTFFTCIIVVSLQIIAFFIAMVLIAFSFMMTYVNLLPSVPQKVIACLFLSWCNVALFVAMVLTARSANLTNYNSSRDLTLASFFADFIQEPEKAREAAGGSLAGAGARSTDCPGQAGHPPP